MSGNDATEDEERRASTHHVAVFVLRQRLVERQRQAVEICDASTRNQSAPVGVNTTHSRCDTEPSASLEGMASI